MEIPEDADNDEYDGPSSADIEVIHEKNGPKLQSILKQRTLSESSDDYGTNGESSRPCPEDDLSLNGRFRKSVSFNNHIDKTTYKPSASPTSMKTALKSKRRRARKKDEKVSKRAGRRRHNSGGSECSSGDDVSSEHTNSDSQTDEKNGEFEQIEEEGVDGFTESLQAGGSPGKDYKEFRTSGQVCAAGNNAGDLKQMVDGLKQFGCGDTDSNDDLKQHGHGDTNSDNLNQLEIEDFNVQGHGDTNLNDVKQQKNEFMQHEDDAKADGFRTAQDDKITTDSDEADDDDDDRTSNSVSEVESKSGAQMYSGGDNKNLDNNSSKRSTPVIEAQMVSSDDVSRPGSLKQLVEEDGSSFIRINANHHQQAGQHNCDNMQPTHKQNGENNNQDSDDDDNIETELSWKEGEVPGFDNEHRTQCAFKFSNSLIYDLDID